MLTKADVVKAIAARRLAPKITNSRHFQLVMSDMFDRIPAQFRALFAREGANDDDEACARVKRCTPHRTRARAAEDEPTPTPSPQSSSLAPAFVTELEDMTGHLPRVGDADGVAFGVRVERTYTDARAALCALKCTLAHPLCVPDVVSNGAADVNYLRLTASAAARRRLGVADASSPTTHNHRHHRKHHEDDASGTYDGLSIADARLVDELQHTLAALKSRVSALEETLMD